MNVTNVKISAIKIPLNLGLILHHAKYIKFGFLSFSGFFAWRYAFLAWRDCIGKCNGKLENAITGL